MKGLQMIIRGEQEADAAAIDEVTAAAFKDNPHSQQTEVFIIRELRKAGALAVSLVAQVDGKVVGHVAFSPLAVSDGSAGWYGVGPLSVTPALQKQGIGSALMNEGISLLKSQGAKGCVLVGYPEYYRRFGFENTSDMSLEGVPPEVFMALPFGESRAHGSVQFHNAFRTKG